MAKALFISTNGGIVETTYDSLESGQRAVGGLIEFAQVSIDGHDLEVIVNEEGLIFDLPINGMARDLFGVGLAGDLLVVGPLDFDAGMSTDLPDAARDAILARAKAAMH